MTLGDLFKLTIVNRFNYSPLHPFNEAKDHVIHIDHVTTLAWLIVSVGIHWRHCSQAHKGTNMVGQHVIHQRIFDPVPKGYSSGAAGGKDNI